MRVFRRTAALVLALGFVGSGAFGGERTTDAVVHEWGTFTTHHDATGTPVVWMPLQVESDLPEFVYTAKTNETQKNTYPGTVRMETPVLYFYTDRKETLSVHARFTGNLISEWYPKAKGGLDGIRWPRVTLLPGATPSLPVEAGESHYYPARETDAVVVRCKTKRGLQHEKFLFYRGVGTFDLPIHARAVGDDVEILPVGPDAVAQAIVVERRGDALGFRTVALAGAPVVVPRPVAAPDALANLEATLQTALVGAGLFEREATAMIATWRTTWSEEGVRVLYLVPTRIPDAVLPLDIHPTPAAIVRVFVGRAEILPAEPPAQP